MQHKAIAGIIVARLVLAPWAAAEGPSPRDPAPTTIRETAARETTRLAQDARRGPMPAGLKWTGTGLLIGSGFPVFIAKFADCTSGEFSCRDQRHAAYAVAGVMAGTGALLLVIANAKRSTLWPSVSVQDGRASITQRITF
jgi:hypothetical protein